MKTLLFLIVFPVMLFGQFNKLTPLSSYVRKGSFGTGTQYWTKSSATGMDFGTSTDFSIVMQFKTTSAATLQRLLAKKTNASGGGDPGFMVEIRSSRIRVNIGDATATAQVISNATIQNGQLYSLIITATRTGNAVIYINGIIDNSGSISTVGSITNALTLGVAGSINGSNPLIGTLGRIQVISGKALSTTEVYALNNKARSMLPNTYPGATTVLNIDWKNNGNDLSSQGNNLTASNGPYIGTY